MCAIELRDMCKLPAIRQWPKEYDLCHTFLHVVRVRKHTDMRELHAFQKTHGVTDMLELHVKHEQFSHVRVFSD